MLTGQQIIQARRLLRWSLARTATVAGIPVEKLLSAQSNTDWQNASLATILALHRAFETAGVRFSVEDGVPVAELGVRRKAIPTGRQGADRTG